MVRQLALRHTATMHSFLNHTKRDSGYTLLELLLVLTLTALLMLAGSYGWRQHQSARQLTSSAQQLLDFIVRQQWHAAWGNRRCRLTAITGDRWQLRGDPQCSLVRGAAETARCIASYTGVHLSVSTAELSLGGVRHTAGAAHLVLSNSAGRLRVVLSGRGRVRLCSEQGRWAGIPSC